MQAAHPKDSIKLLGRVGSLAALARHIQRQSRKYYNVLRVERTLGECLAVTVHSNPVDLSLSLGDVATPATFLLRPLSFLQQRTTICKSQNPQTGQEHRILGKGTHTHTFTHAARRSHNPKGVFNNRTIQVYIKSQ